MDKWLRQEINLNLLFLKPHFFLYHISFENFPIGKKNSLKVKVIDKFLRIFFFKFIIILIFLSREIHLYGKRTLVKNFA